MKRGQLHKIWAQRKKRTTASGSGESGLSRSGMRQKRIGGAWLQGPLRFVSGLRKWYVAMKYQLFRLSGGFLGRGGFPWIRFSLLAICLFLLFKKDLQFTVNLGQLKKQEQGGVAQREQSGVDRLSLGAGLTSASAKKAEAGEQPNWTVAHARDLSEDAVRAYIDRFEKVARMEMKKFGIPASIKMAQGLAESHAGQLPANRGNHNHFGDPLQAMSYQTAWENWRAHSVLLQQRYPELFELRDLPEAWADGLQEAGYSQDQQYAQKLMSIINAFDLEKLDRVINP